MRIKVKTTFDNKASIELPETYDLLLANEKEKAFLLFCLAPKTKDDFEVR
jgi:hypothetical protein